MLCPVEVWKEISKEIQSYVKLTKAQQTPLKLIDFHLKISSWTPENIFHLANICITSCIAPSLSGSFISLKCLEV